LIGSAEVYSIQYYVIKFVSDLRQRGRLFSPVSSTNETGLHDITEMLKTRRSGLDFIKTIEYPCASKFTNQNTVSTNDTVHVLIGSFRKSFCSAVPLTRKEKKNCIRNVCFDALFIRQNSPLLPFVFVGMDESVIIV